MTKTGKMIPKMRFKQFMNSDAWEQRELNEVVDLCSGRDYKHLAKGNIPVYGTGGYMLSVNDALSYDKDAIGIGRKGTIDKPYILESPFWTVDTLFYAVPRAKCNLDFLYGIFQNIDWKQKDESTGVPSLSKITINSVEVKVPEFSEQKKIGSLFIKIDNLITLHQRKLEKVQAIKKAYLTEMFPQNGESVPKRRFAGYSDAWEQCKLGEIATYFNGGSFENNVSDTGVFELVTLKSVDMNGRLVHSGRFVNVEVPTLKKGTLIMILSEQSPGLLGMTARIPTNNRYILNQRVAEIRPLEIIDSTFLSMSINRNQQYFSKRGAGTKVQNISKSNVENFEFLCPSLDEQLRLGAFFSSIDNLITLHQHKLEKLKNLKKAYLNELFI